jgi:hypothetical protein
MNTFGIDHQPGVTFVALREGAQETAPVASVGDGVRSMIPNTVSPEGYWGSRALGRPGAYSPGGARGAWIEDPGASLFWKGLYARLGSYLGRMAPVRANGYRLAIALQGDEYNTDAHAVTALARAAGFDDVVLLPSTYALLCRWLASPGVHEHQPRTVITIAVGEVATLGGGFHLEWNLRGLPAVRAASLPTSLQEAGYETWNRRLLELLRVRLKEAPAEGYLDLLRDAALRYAVRLSQARIDQPVQWRETLEEQLYAPLSLSHAQCAAWPECVALGRSLPDAVRAALTTLGSSTADLLVVGGIGSVWPVVEKIAAVLGPVWRSSAAGDDVAVGAAWWGELCQYASGALLTMSPVLDVATEQTGSTRELPEQSRAFLPPWERGAADVD